MDKVDIKVEIIKQIKEYYEMEYKNASRVALYNKWSDTQELTKYCVRDTLSRCLGVALFVQQLDIDYEVISLIFELYKEKFNKLLDN